MAEILFPQTSTPGEHRQQGRGRLINMFWEPIITDERQAQANKSVWRRVAGTVLWGETGADLDDPYRNMLFAASRLYVAHGGTVRSFGVAGSSPVTLSGVIAGSPTKLIWARNNKVAPDIIAVSPGDGAYLVTPTTVSTFSGLPSVPNSVCSISGFLVFSAGDGRMMATEPNSTIINTLNYAYAETRPDTLLRVVPVGNGQLLACGDTSMEVWGPPINPPPGFPFSYVSAIPFGLIGRNAIAGTEDGWTRGLFFVSGDHGVYSLNNFQPLKISPPDLDRLIKQTSNVDSIEVSVFGHSGHGVVVVQTPEWCWHFDTNTLKWHERQSYLQNYWRHLHPVYAWNVWVCGDRETANLYVIDRDIETEAGAPLVAQIIGVVDTFPAKTRIAKIELDVTHGVGITTGSSIITTNPQMHIAYSDNGGVDYSDPTKRPFNEMGRPQGICTVRNCGITRTKMFNVKVSVSDPVSFALLGGNVEAA